MHRIDDEKKGQLGQRLRSSNINRRRRCGRGRVQRGSTKAVVIEMMMHKVALHASTFDKNDNVVTAMVQCNISGRLIGGIFQAML